MTSILFRISCYFCCFFRIFFSFVVRLLCKICLTFYLNALGNMYGTSMWARCSRLTLMFTFMLVNQLFIHFRQKSDYLLWKLMFADCRSRCELSRSRKRFGQIEPQFNLRMLHSANSLNVYKTFCSVNFVRKHQFIIDKELKKLVFLALWCNPIEFSLISLFLPLSNRVFEILRKWLECAIVLYTCFYLFVG